MMNFRAYRPYRIEGIYMPQGVPGFRYAGLTCDVISRLKAVAIGDRAHLYLFIVNSTFCSSLLPTRF